MSDNEQQETSEQPPLKLVRVPIIAGLVLMAAYGIYFGLIKKASGGGPDSWGQFGDFLGGLLNPVVGTITIVLLVHTLQSQLKAVELQRKELALQRKELQLQRAETARSTEALAAQNKAIMMQSFEQTFFAWLQSYRQLVDSFEQGGIKGQRILSHWIQLCLASNHDSPAADRAIFKRNLTYKEATEAYISGVGQSLAIRYKSALAEYERTYEAQHPSLGPMLRSLYRLIEWVDKSSLEYVEKWHYIAIVRSQLSWPEMMVIVYNGATDRGRNFVPLINKYALLDNLESTTDHIVAAMRGPFVDRAPEHFPYSKCAFNSGVAKLELGIVEAKDL
ncbi:putative phage abortive infection protein [Achromobacter marplatensis]|uniref:Phage abortive infection protein n=1 Tax=Achromobacter marplatensis TaxID=470868 RepID=A0AA43B3D0_9BURK|nr:putative phage abortive infection protein [Achromobacter marplatensis]MDH2052547.1 putative phage abortive infection protein [Achromobacter marplatensis]